MNIGQVAAASGVSAKTIRFYEQVGLLKAAARTNSNYRVYADADIHDLRFIKRARGLGFSVAETSRLLELWRDRSRDNEEVRRVAMAHLADLDAKISELEGMRGALRHLVSCCRGNERPECPILDDLAGIPSPDDAAAPLDDGARKPSNRSAAAAKDEAMKTPQAEPGQAAARFVVSDMTCAHCEKTIRKALASEFPGATVEVDLARHLVSVEADITRAEAAIRDAGYTPRPAGH